MDICQTLYERHQMITLCQGQTVVILPNPTTQKTAPATIAATRIAQAVKYNKARENPDALVQKQSMGMINKVTAHDMRSSQRRKHTKQLHYPKPKAGI